jgi:hypothetical protein
MRSLVRKSRVLTAEFGDGELVVFDCETRRYHRLNPLCAFVWQNSSSVTAMDDVSLALQGQVDPADSRRLVLLAEAELRRVGLLVDGEEEAGGDVGARELQPVARREALRRLAAGGVGMTLLPVVTSLAAPSRGSAQAVPGLSPPIDT